MYAFAEDAFDLAMIARGTELAGPAAIAVNHAALIASTRLLHAQLTEAGSERATIETAVGVLMLRGGIDAAEARDHLREIAALQHVDLATVADILVADAVVWSRPKSQTC